MSERYCARIENGVVVQVIVCNSPGWASQHLGGEWLCTQERLVGIGWPVVDGEIVEPEPVEGDSDQPIAPAPAPAPPSPKRPPGPLDTRAWPQR